MERHPFAFIAGDTGRASMTGGCIAPVSLHLTFFVEPDCVVLTAQSERYISPSQSLEGERRISLERYRQFAEAVEAVLEGPTVEPAYSTGQLAVGVSLPMPKRRLVGGGHEMNQGPDPNALEKLTSDLVYEAWNIERPALGTTEPIPRELRQTPEGTPPKDTRTFDKIRRYAPFLMPLTVFALAAYCGQSRGGRRLRHFGILRGRRDLQHHGYGMVLDLWDGGLLYRRCDASHPCPGGMECRQATVMAGVGTKWAFHYRKFQDTYCVPRQ